MLLLMCEVHPCFISGGAYIQLEPERLVMSSGPSLWPDLGQDIPQDEGGPWSQEMVGW